MKTAQVASILTEVIDPELGIDIVSLGLIYGIDVDDQRISVTMTMTSPDCPMGDTIAGMVAARLARRSEGRAVALVIASEPEWAIRMADADALRRLGLGVS